MNPLTGAVVLCGIVCTAVVAMSPESVELQTRLLRGIYDEAVKDSHLQGDDSEELNLLKNESAGFATSVLSFSEKGVPVVRDGNRITMFNLSMLSEPKESQVLVQLAVKVPTLEYFSCVRYLYVTSDCMSSSSPGEQQLIAAYRLQDEDRESEWLQVTIDCEDCNWQLLQQAHFILQLRDDADTPVPFTDETATDLNTFLILFTSKTLLPFEDLRESALRKRQAESDTSTLRPVSEQTPLVNENRTTENDTSSLRPVSEPISFVNENRTTVEELRQRNVSCSKHEVFLTQNEIHYKGDVLAPYPGALKLTYCLGHCTLAQQLPSNNETRLDSRTKILIHELYQLRQRLHPPPCCIPAKIIATELIIREEDMVGISTFPNIAFCKCQL